MPRARRRQSSLAAPAALLAGWSSAALPFFPAYWPGGLAAVALLLTLAGPRLGLAFALAVPVLPLGNISLGLAILYGVLACGWFALFWARPRAALLFLAGPLLAPLGALGLLPLVSLPAGGPFRRAALTVAAVLAAAVTAGAMGHGLPFAGGVDLSLGGVDSPLTAASALWGGLTGAQGLLLETLALGAAAAAVGACRRRGPWGAARVRGARRHRDPPRRPGHLGAAARRSRLGERGPAGGRARPDAADPPVFGRSARGFHARGRACGPYPEARLGRGETPPVNVLRSIEQKIEGLFEGLFGRAFRTNVQPVELARKLVKEMDDHRTVSVSRIYVPNEYTVYLSPPDREQFADYEGSLTTELQDYLAEHARREGYVLLTAPIVLMETDDDLAVGEFGIATRMAQREPGRGEPSPPPQLESGATMVYKPRTQIPPDGPPADVALAQEIVTLTMDGIRHEIDKRRFVLGRSKDCDIQLADPNVSRRHAELRQEGSAYWLIDLDSTNGSQVNGHRTARAKLESGDTITVGSTDLVFERRLAE